MSTTNFSASPEFVRDVVAAGIKHKKRIKIWYIDKQGKTEIRMVEPLEMPNEKNFTAWCLLRNNFRHFSYDRIMRVALTDYDRTFVEEEKVQVEVQIGDQKVTG